MSQKELILLFQEDREAAFRQIYQLAFPKVARLVGRRGGNLEEAKDIFHESLIILYERCRLETLEIKGSVINYVIGMCRNQWSSHLRRQSREILTADFSEQEWAAPAPEEPNSDNRLLTYLEKAGKKCLDLLQAVYYFRYSMQEIAEEFGFRTVRSATVQKYKCMEKVRNEVSKLKDETIPA